MRKITKIRIPEMTRNPIQRSTMSLFCRRIITILFTKGTKVSGHQRISVIRLVLMSKIQFMKAAVFVQDRKIGLLRRSTQPREAAANHAVEVVDTRDNATSSKYHKSLDDRPDSNYRSNNECRTERPTHGIRDSQWVCWNTARLWLNIRHGGAARHPVPVARLEWNGRPGFLGERLAGHEKCCQRNGHYGDSSYDC